MNNLKVPAWLVPVLLAIFMALATTAYTNLDGRIARIERVIDTQVALSERLAVVEVQTKYISEQIRLVSAKLDELWAVR